MTLETWSEVVELRNYALHEGQREVLLDLFDREFVESQEAVGMHVIGQFRDVADPNSFVWLRGFTDMPARKRGLETFYGGSVWKQFGPAANATMVDSDNVLLLRPARPSSGFRAPSRSRAMQRSADAGGRLVMAIVYSLDSQEVEPFVDSFERVLAPRYRMAGATVLAYFRNERSRNNFPRLPIRDENVFVWFAGFETRNSKDPVIEQLCETIKQSPELFGKQSPKVMLLAPTSRSLVTGAWPPCPVQSSTSSPL